MTDVSLMCAGEVLLLRTENAMDKYFHRFSLADLHDFLVEKEKEMVRLMS